MTVAGTAAVALLAALLAGCAYTYTMRDDGGRLVECNLFGECAPPGTPPAEPATAAAPCAADTTALGVARKVAGAVAEVMVPFYSFAEQVVGKPAGSAPCPEK